MEEYYLEKNGRRRVGRRRNCLHCNGSFVGRIYSDGDEQVFCGGRCATNARAEVQRINTFCGFCNRPLVRAKSRLAGSRSGLLFCDRMCKQKAQSLEGGVAEIQPSHYGTGIGLSDYRERALKSYGAECQVCGYYEDTRMLDVHHLDSNRLNNLIGNLQVLCVWCHALHTRKNWPADK